MTPATLYSLAADLVLIVHVAFAMFVVLGLVAIWIGWWRKWAFVRNRSFRFAHIGAMGVVVLESVFGVACPLTAWEKSLRVAAGQDAYAGSFMQHWIHKIMFFNLPPAVFTAIYILFFLGIVLSFVVIRPEPRQRASAGPISRDLDGLAQS